MSVTVLIASMVWYPPSHAGVAHLVRCARIHPPAVSPGGSRALPSTPHEPVPHRQAVHNLTFAGGTENTVSDTHPAHPITMHTSVSVKVYSRTSSWEDGFTNVSFLAFTCMVLSLVIAMSASGPGQCYSATAHVVYIKRDPPPHFFHIDVGLVVRARAHSGRHDTAGDRDITNTGYQTHRDPVHLQVTVRVDTGLTWPVCTWCIPLRCIRRSR
jgi:hypothetical protein